MLNRTDNGILNAGNIPTIGIGKWGEQYAKKLQGVDIWYLLLTIANRNETVN